MYIFIPLPSLHVSNAICLWQIELLMCKETFVSPFIRKHILFDYE